MRRPGEPPDLPARAVEQLPRAGDPQRPLRHPGQRGDRDVFDPVVGEVGVHLVGDRDRVELAAQGRDLLEVLTRQHGARGIVRRVDQHGPRPRRERVPQRVHIDSDMAARADQPRGATSGPGHRHRGHVGVVIRLDDDHLVVVLHQAHHRGGDGLRRADRHQRLGVRIVHQAGARRLVGDDRVTQLGDPRPGRVLVVAVAKRPHRRLDHRLRPVRVREALAQVDRVELRCQARDLGEDRRGVGRESADRHGGSLGDC